MSHLSDKELDRLSREAAEQNDVPQNASGWDSLHQRLEKELPENPRRQRRNMFLLLSLLVMLTGSGLIYRYANGPVILNQENPESATNTGQSRNTQEAVSPEKETLPLNPNTDNKQPDNSTLGTSQIPGKKLNDETSSTTVNPNPKSETISKAESPNAISEIPNSISQTPNSKPQTPNVLSQTPNSISKTPNSKPQTSGGISQSQNSISKNRNSKPQTPNAVPESSIPEMAEADVEASMAGIVPSGANIEISKPAIERNPISENGTDQIAPSIKADNKNQKQSSTKFPFSISVVGGADWTTVKFTHKENAGYNAGLTVTWHFARDFSVTTGAIYTKKNYSAYGKDYHPPKGYWTNYITLDEVNGSCWMIDIPLNVRYDFAKQKQSSFFASAGASSYLMDKESYTYHYMYNGVYNNRKWNNDNNSSHLFSIINLSGGFEKNVGKNVSAQIEPYLKIPITGIGFGNMQMNSYGLNFAIRYRPELKKKNTSVPDKHP